MKAKLHIIRAGHSKVVVNCNNNIKRERKVGKVSWLVIENIIGIQSRQRVEFGKDNLSLDPLLG
jgi:hypothetical protein